MSTAVQLKLSGMKLAAAAHKDTLQAARLVAQFLGGRGETISIVDIRAYFGANALRQASGSVFLTGEWEPAGHIKTTHDDGHAREVKTWRMKRANQSEGLRTDEGGKV